MKEMDLTTCPPLGSWLRQINDTSGTMSLIISIGYKGIIEGQGVELSYKQLFNQAEYSTDSGVTWKYCRID